MKNIKNLVKGDYIAFGFNYNGGKPNQIIVDNITEVFSDEVLVHFMYGLKSLSEIVKKEDILAIGNEKTGEGKVYGWSGKYDILNQKRIDEILAK
jgi:hypothetical protein